MKIKLDPGAVMPTRAHPFNHGATAYMVNPGDKIAQLVIVPCCLPPLEEVDVLEITDRGTNGFGSTGQ